MNKNTIFKLYGPWDPYPCLHFHCLVQEDGNEGDGVDWCSKGKDVYIWTSVGLRRKNKQAWSSRHTQARMDLRLCVQYNEAREGKKDGEKKGEKKGLIQGIDKGRNGRRD